MEPAADNGPVVGSSPAAPTTHFAPSGVLHALPNCASVQRFSAAFSESCVSGRVLARGFLVSAPPVSASWKPFPGAESRDRFASVGDRSQRGSARAATHPARAYIEGKRLTMLSSRRSPAAWPHQRRGSCISAKRRPVGKPTWKGCAVSARLLTAPNYFDGRHTLPSSLSRTPVCRWKLSSRGDMSRAALIVNCSGLIEAIVVSFRDPRS